jgi:uncharacterized protein (UPF0332 family)
MTDRMSASEIERYLELSRDEPATAGDNLDLGHLRAATSRAYYAMFYAATALLGSRGEWRSKYQGVITAFGELFVKTGIIEADYGRLLHSAFSARLRSDYDPGAETSVDLAKQLVADAVDFVQRIEGIIHDHDG